MNFFANHARFHYLAFGTGIVAFSLFSLGCEESTSAQQETKNQRSSKTANEETKSPNIDSTAKADKSGNVKKVEMGRNVWLEVQGEKRRVIVQAEVCLRDAMLEHLMT